MAQQQKCPQCGTQLFNEYYTSVVCPMCGWGKSEGVTLAPPSGLAYKLSMKSRRWKFGAAAIAIVALLLVTPLIKFSRNQVMANQAVATARGQMDKRLYASAARTLNEAPRAQTTSNTKTQLNALLSDTVRWAHDISDADSAKTSMLEGDSEDALDELDEIDEDFPQEDEADELTEYAQDMEIDEEYEVSEDELDDAFYIPEDPAMPELDELETAAQQQNDDDDDSVTTTTDPATAPGTPSTDESEETTTSGDTGEEQVTEDELPEAPAVHPSTPVNSVANKAPRLAVFYQIVWDTNTDHDNFYTIDQKNEVAPGKDKKSGFGGYKLNGAIGQVYNRKPANSPGVVPLYRYWSAKQTNHYYTTSSKFATGKNTNYVKQQVAGYVGKWDGQKCLAGTKPLYTLYSSKVTNNMYTSNVDVKNQLVAAGNYKNPQIIGCVW